MDGERMSGIRTRSLENHQGYIRSGCCSNGSLFTPPRSTTGPALGLDASVYDRHEAPTFAAAEHVGPVYPAFPANTQSRFTALTAHTVSEWFRAYFRSAFPHLSEITLRPVVRDDFFVSHRGFFAIKIRQHASHVERGFRFA